MANEQPPPELSEPLVQPPGRTAGGNDDVSHRKIAFIIRTSLVVAITWWGFGLYTVIVTRSLSLLASLVDATIDLAAQGVLLFANKLADADTQTGGIYPVGFSRIEPIGVIVCALLMALASGAVIYESASLIYTTWPVGDDEMTFTTTAAAMLSVVVLAKIVVWRIAKAEYDKTNNVSLEALALDNYNDILSNFSALLFASLTQVAEKYWWVDPVGGILISLYIIRSWGITAVEQVNMLVGKAADPEFLQKVEELARNHDPNAELDIVRAYHFGPKFMVEVELVMDRKTPLEVSHDVGMLLQDRIEHLDECERCFVHIDYQRREKDDHDKSVPLQDKVCPTRIPGSEHLRLRQVYRPLSSAWLA